MSFALCGPTVDKGTRTSGIFEGQVKKTDRRRTYTERNEADGQLTPAPVPLLQDELTERAAHMPTERTANSVKFARRNEKT